MGLVIPDPDPDFLPIPDPGSRGQKGTGSRIRKTSVPAADTGCVEGVETLVDTGAVAAVVDELVLAAQLVVEDGGLVLSHVVAVPVCPVRSGRNIRFSPCKGRT
jgi:hypothetical protein